MAGALKPPPSRSTLLPGWSQRAASPGPLGCSSADTACAELIERISGRVRDPTFVLCRLRHRARDASQRGEVLVLLRKPGSILAARPPCFAGTPELAITSTPLLALRAHGEFGNDLGRLPPLIDRATGTARRGDEQGEWLAHVADRRLNAVLSTWGNPMDTVDVQEIPAGSLLLRGIAAAMRGRSTWDGARDVPAEALPGGALQLAHLGQCPDDGAVQSRRARRPVLESYTLDRQGRPLRAI